MKNFLIILQIIISLFLIILITLQSKGGGLGTALGESSLYSQRRGVEKVVFYFTILLVLFFLTISLANLLF